MLAVNVLLEKLLDAPLAAVSDAGTLLLNHLSENRLSSSAFLEDPLLLVGPPYYAPRYLAQVTLRALQGEYDTADEIISSLQSLQDRNPPTLEPGRQASAERIVIPEAKVVDLRHPVRNDTGGWQSSIVALVTSGSLRRQEIEIQLRSSESPTACFLVRYLWIHSTIAAYNLVPAGGAAFTGCPETFVVIEPMRQVNATSVARSLRCTKPQLDQIRRGKGDVTIHTLKGTMVHAMFDRLLEGETDLQSIYDAVLPRHLVQIASIVDEFFDEKAFRDEVFRHLTALQGFVGANPRLLQDPQLELKRYSATIGIQGRMDAVFQQGTRLDILELKTGARIRPEDHAQLFIYRLLLSDLVRRWQRDNGKGVDISARLLSSTDGAFAPLQIHTDFQQVLDARNKLVATHYGLGRRTAHFKFRYEGFNDEICGDCVSWTRTRCKETSQAFGDRPGSPETPELEYFRRFTRLIERERWCAEQELSDLLDDSRTEMRKRNFRTVLHARIVPAGEPFTFEFDENTSDLAFGDSVLIHAGNISSTPAFHGYVREIDTRHVRVSIPIKNLEGRVLEGQEWIIDRFPSDVTAEASHTALYDFLRAPRDSKKDAVLGIAGPAESEIRNAPASTEFPSANPSQSLAIERASQCRVYHLIWGPPGTGKTRVVPEILRCVNGPVLLGAFTNTAVDRMLMSLLASDRNIRFLRVGRSSDSPELAACLDDPTEYFSDDLALKHGTIHAVRRAMDSARIVAATAHRACTLPYLRQRAFEMTIVDEAGQLTEPLTLGLILRGRRFVLIGDDKQLPPVVRTRGLGQSMFERLKREAGTGSAALTLLDTQYRMHPEIMSVSNALFYGGRLRAGVSAADRLPPDGMPVTFVPVEGSPEERRNRHEAEAVARLVRLYCDVHGVPAAAIGVVSPFRAQVVLMRSMLKDTGITVDTVERFQGGERDIMILSFVRPNGSDFVFDERRFNVAITRARRKLILVAHPELFRNSRYEWICTFTETPKTVGMI